MRVLDLFAGLGGWSQAFIERGHEVVTLDLDPAFGCTITADILTVEPDDLPGPFDLILASPPCECFSVASIGTHWTGGRRVYAPKTVAAADAMRIVEKTRFIIDYWQPRAWIIENPRGVLRKLPLLVDCERRTVTYCAFGLPSMKPTDLWGGFPPTLRLPEPCQNGDPCHERAPRGAKTGTQGICGSANRAKIPHALSLRICLAMENLS